MINCWIRTLTKLAQEVKPAPVRVGPVKTEPVGWAAKALKSEAAGGPPTVGGKAAKANREYAEKVMRLRTRPRNKKPGRWSKFIGPGGPMHGK